MKLLPLLFLLTGCSDLPRLDRVDFTSEADSSFMVACSKGNCHERAEAICSRQGFAKYDIIEETRGDELGEGRGVVIQCKEKA
jgi:hypothetical protein